MDVNEGTLSDNLYDEADAALESEIAKLEDGLMFLTPYEVGLSTDASLQRETSQRDFVMSASYPESDDEYDFVTLEEDDNMTEIIEEEATVETKGDDEVSYDEVTVTTAEMAELGQYQIDSGSATTEKSSVLEDLMAQQQLKMDTLLANSKVKCPTETLASVLEEEGECIDEYSSLLSKRKGKEPEAPILSSPQRTNHPVVRKEKLANLQSNIEISSNTKNSNIDQLFVSTDVDSSRRREELTNQLSVLLLGLIEESADKVLKCEDDNQAKVLGDFSCLSDNDDALEEEIERLEHELGVKENGQTVTSSDTFPSQVAKFPRQTTDLSSTSKLIPAITERSSKSTEFTEIVESPLLSKSNVPYIDSHMYTGLCEESNVPPLLITNVAEEVSSQSAPSLLTTPYQTTQESLITQIQPLLLRSPSQTRKPDPTPMSLISTQSSSTKSSSASPDQQSVSNTNLASDNVVVPSASVSSKFGAENLTTNQTVAYTTSRTAILDSSADTKIEGKRKMKKKILARKVRKKVPVETGCIPAEGNIVSGHATSHNEGHASNSLQHQNSVKGGDQHPKMKDTVVGVSSINKEMKERLALPEKKEPVTPIRVAPSKSLISSRIVVSDEEKAAAMEFQKMLKIGLPEGAVRHKMALAGVDQNPNIVAVVFGSNGSDKNKRTVCHGNADVLPREEAEAVLFEEDVVKKPSVKDEPTSLDSAQPSLRNLLGAIETAATRRVLRLEETDGELLMQEFSPEVDAKCRASVQISTTMAETISAKAAAREKRLAEGGEKRMRKVEIKEKEEYKKEFTNIVSDAASMGRLTRLDEYTVEAVAGEKRPLEEWRSKGLLAIQWQSNHMAVIHDAARAGNQTKLPEEVVSNYQNDEIKADDGILAEKCASPRLLELLELNTQVGAGQQKVERLVLGRKEEQNHEHLLIKPMQAYSHIEDIKLPRNTTPKIDPVKNAERLSKMKQKIICGERPMEDISLGVAERAWERRARLDRPGSSPRVTEKCTCAYCGTSSPYQTFAYRELARKHKEEEEELERKRLERKRIRAEKRRLQKEVEDLEAAVAAAKAKVGNEAAERRLVDEALTSTGKESLQEQQLSNLLMSQELSSKVVMERASDSAGLGQTDDKSSVVGSRVEQWNKTSTKKSKYAEKNPAETGCACVIM